MERQHIDISSIDLGKGDRALRELRLSPFTLVARAIPELLEVSIGHALIADALAREGLDHLDRYIRLLFNEPDREDP